MRSSVARSSESPASRSPVHPAAEGVADPTMMRRPGTNRRDVLAGADWRYLLGRLELERVLLIGSPVGRAVWALASHAAHVVVACPDGILMDDLSPPREPPPPDIQGLRLDPSRSLPIADDSVSEVVVFGQDLVGWRIPAGRLAGEIDRILRADGSVYVESGGARSALLVWRLVRELERRGAECTTRYWLAPRRGRIKVALPRGDRAVARHIFGDVLHAGSTRNRALRSAGFLASRVGALDVLAPRRAVLLRRHGQAAPRGRNGSSTHLDRWALRAGLEADGHRAALWARGEYDSNKVAFFLFEARADRPRAIVKITRAPRFNRRLANARRALARLAEQEGVERGSYPEVLFFERRAGLAVLGERIVSGVPFREKMGDPVSCPYARDAAEWLITLGAVSARPPSPADPRTARLRHLHAHFVETYRPERELRSFLARQVARLEGAGPRLPVVFQHGDPGTWNLLVDDEDRVVFLDWEAATPAGLPLWDLFYFLRSLATWDARRRGETDRRTIYARAFLRPDAALAPRQEELVRRYCAAVGVGPDLVGPLFHTCWMHRAVKEASRLRPGSLQGGTYVGLVRLCVRERRRGGLRWMRA